MQGDADIARVASLLAEPARARVLLALADGRELPASVLAAEAGVAPSTASSHLHKLIDGGLLSVQRDGRQRYFRLAGEDVAQLIEALARISPPAPVRSLRAGTRAQAIRYARTCYDHLAGVLGTELMASLLEREVLEPEDGDYRLTDEGRNTLERFGVEFDGLPRRRPLIRYCVDWSERRHHLAGALGAAICSRAFELGWVSRASGSRAVRITERGQEGLLETFGVTLP